MDTGTHLVVGVGLGGLAYVDPVVASDSLTAIAVLFATVIGSQIPDSDGLLRFRGNASYIRNHRGKSHSLPALAIWTILITLVLSIVFQGVSILHLALWTFIAVAVHVFMDCFNSYGTQAYRPFNEKWVSWNIIHIFDPVLFSGHVIAILLWFLQLAAPEVIFPSLYVLVAFYYVWRTVAHWFAIRNVKLQDPNFKAENKYLVIPTMHLYHWNIVKSLGNDRYELGEYKSGRLRWVDTVECDSHQAITESKSHPDVAAFLYLTSHACAELKEHSWGYEVRWADVRYRHRKQYPFVAVLLMDKQYQAMDSYVGWLNEDRLEKRLKMDAY